MQLEIRIEKTVKGRWINMSKFMSSCYLFRPKSLEPIGVKELRT